MFRSKWIPWILIALLLPLGAAENRKPEEDSIQHPTETVEVVGHIPLNRSVQSVTVYDSKQLQEMGRNGLKEILDRTPGFLVLNGGHYGQMAYAFARGAAVNQTLYIIDGVKVTDPSSSLGINLTLMPARMFERVEIVRGPLSGIYGSNAMGGVVSLTTHRDDGVTASAGFGSHGSYEAGIHTGRQFGSWHLSVNANLTRYSDDLENDTFSNNGITAGAMFRRGRVETGIRMFFHSASSGIPLNMGNPSPNREYDQTSMTATIPIAIHVSENTRIRFRFFHNANAYEFRDPDDIWSPFFKNRSRINEAETSISGKLSTFLNYRAGAEASFQSIFNQTGDTPDLDNEKTNYFSGFLSADLDLGSILISTSIRADKYRDIDSAWSPQIGASWLISEHIKVRASWGESFRAPTLPERLNPNWGNPDLEPERSRSLEAGIEIFVKRLTLGVTGFDTSYRQLIGFSPLTNAYTNLSKATIRGLEFDASWRPVDQLELRSAWTWLDTNDLQYDRQLLRRPKHALSAGITWTHPRFTLGGEMVYVGRRLDYNELDWMTPIAESPSFNTFAFNLQVTITRNLAFQARITNAFNTEYQEVFGYPAPGTRVMAGLRFHTR